MRLLSSSTSSKFQVLELCSRFSVCLIQTGLRVPPMSRAVPEGLGAGGQLVPQGHTRRCLSAVESREPMEEEEEEGEKGEGNDFHPAPLRRSGAFRTHNHHYDPFKRHSWGSGGELQDPLGR